MTRAVIAGTASINAVVQLKREDADDDYAALVNDWGSGGFNQFRSAQSPEQVGRHPT